MALRKPSLSIFFPCYNDAGSIAQLVDDATKTAQSLVSDFEVIVIDDGSKDNSREILKSVAKTNKKLKLVFHVKNKGYGGALRSGFKTCSKDLVFYTDCDGQYDVNELPILFSLMTDDVNFVNGIKMRRHDAAHRVFFGNLHKFVNRWVFWLPVYDVDCDFRLIRREIVRKMNMECNTGAICIELVKRAERAGAIFRQVSVHHYDRKFGQSQFFRIDRIAKTYLDLARLWIKLMVIEPLS